MCPHLIFSVVTDQVFAQLLINFCLQRAAMGKPNIIGIVSHQSENGRLEKEKDSEVPLKAEREKLVAISFNRGTLLRTRPCSSKNIRIDQDFPKEKGDENKENLLGDDDATIVISSDEEEDAKKGNDEKRCEDLKRRAYQFLDQFFDKNPSMLAELKAKMEVVFVILKGLKLTLMRLHGIKVMTSPFDV